MGLSKAKYLSVISHDCRYVGENAGSVLVGAHSPNGHSVQFASSRVDSDLKEEALLRDVLLVDLRYMFRFMDFLRYVTCHVRAAVSKDLYGSNFSARYEDGPYCSTIFLLLRVGLASTM